MSRPATVGGMLDKHPLMLPLYEAYERHRALLKIQREEGDLRVLEVLQDHAGQNPVLARAARHYLSVHMGWV